MACVIFLSFFLSLSLSLSHFFVISLSKHNKRTKPLRKYSTFDINNNSNKYICRKISWVLFHVLIIYRYIILQKIRHARAPKCHPSDQTVTYLLTLCSSFSRRDATIFDDVGPSLKLAIYELTELSRKKFTREKSIFDLNNFTLRRWN